MTKAESIEVRKPVSTSIFNTHDYRGPYDRSKSYAAFFSSVDKHGKSILKRRTVTIIDVNRQRPA